MEAFSDGVMAIIITIMVLEIKVPSHPTGVALLSLLPVFLSYVLSFIYVGIYWNNHHHLLHTVDKVSGGMLWANLHLLFWLSLIPFTTGWIGENHFAPIPMALYGIVLFMCAVAYFLLQRCILKTQGEKSLLSRAIGKDWKGKISPILYLLAIGASFFSVWVAGLLYLTVAVIWLIPDQRIEVIFAEKNE